MKINLNPGLTELSNSILNEGVDPNAAAVLFGGIERDVIWHLQADPRFCFHGYIPESIYDDNVKEFKVAVLVHGTGRNYYQYRNHFQKFADENNFALIMPIFPAGLIDPKDYHSYKVMNYKGLRYDHILLAMLEQYAEKFPKIKIDKVYMAGHSGGGQFTLRFFYLHPDRLLGASIGAPGRPTYLDDTRDFFWGTKNFHQLFDKELDFREMQNVPIQMLIGELDTEYINETPFGCNRMERICNLKKNFEAHGIAVMKKVVPGMAHIDKGKERLDAIQSFIESVENSSFQPN